MPKVISFEVREEFFELLCGGCSSGFAARVVGVSEETAQKWWRESGVMGLDVVMGRRGGLAGTSPAGVPGCVSGDERERVRRVLSSEDRAVIAAGLNAQWTHAQIARAIGRDRSVVHREVARNSAGDGSYHAAVAHRAAHEHRRRPKTPKLAADPVLCARIEDWMDAGWSPGLIAEVLKNDHQRDAGTGEPKTMMGRVSHETIYRSLYVQTRGALRADLHRQLSLKRAQRKPRGHTGRGGGHTYDNAFRISQRPAEADDRAVAGHWEGDLILGTANGSAIGTLVERSTRFTILLHLPGRHDADNVAEAMIREMGKLPEHLRRSITWDRGSELADYARIQVELKAPVFFCDPHSPWQRGTNENTNRLLRHWFEKGTDLSIHTPADLERIASLLNKRPRPTLDLQTPADRLDQLLNRAAA